MASCHEVSVGVESNDIVFDPVISGVGGGIGALLGFIIAVVIIKCFFLQTIKRRFHSKNVHPSQTEQIHHASDHCSDEQSVSKKQALTTSVRHRNEKMEPSITDLSSDDEDYVDSKHRDNDHVDSSIVSVLCSPSLEIMVQKLVTEKLSQLEKATAQSWNCRHLCMVQVFKLILEEYRTKKQLSQTDYEEILETATKKLDSSLDSFKHPKKEEHHQGEKHLKDSIESETIKHFNSSDNPQALILTYLEVQARFEDDLLECVGLKNASIIHDVLVKSFKTIEENIQLIQEYELKTITDSFHQKLLIAQAYHSGLIAMRELMKKRRHYFEVMLRRLEESDRITHDESEALWDGVKDAIEDKYNKIITGHEDMMMKLHSSLKERRRKTISSLEDQNKKSLKKYKSDVTLHSPSQRIHSYFALLMRTRQEEESMLEALSKNEIADLEKLQKEAKSTLDIEYEEMQERFCESLSSHEALTEKEAQVIMNELLRKNKKADEDVASIIRIQTRIIDRESTSCRSFQLADPSRFSHSETEKDARDQIIREDLKGAKSFLNQQVLLDDEDRHAISVEYKAFGLLLSNCEDLARMAVYHRLDAELLRREIKILLLEKEERRLNSDEDVSNLVKRFDDFRRSYQQENANSYAEAGCSSRSSLDIKQSFLCDLTAGALLNTLLPETKSANKLARYLSAIKEGVLSKARNSDSIDERRLLELITEGREAAQQVEAQLRQEHDMQVKIIKERMKAEHEAKLKKLEEELDVRPYSASSFSTAEVLEKLLRHERSKRDVESANIKVDVTTMTQIYLERIKFQSKLEAALQELDRNVICKLAMLIGMKRNDMLEVVRTSVHRESANAVETKRLLSDFAVCWGDVHGFVTRPVNHQLQENPMVDEKPLKRSKLKPLTKLRPKPGRGQRKNTLKGISLGSN